MTVAIVDVKAYINMLPDTKVGMFKQLAPEEQEKAIFAAQETLLDVYPSGKLNARIVALQALFEVEGESEEYARLQRHGVQSANASGTSVNFKNAGEVNISPNIIAILGEGRKRGVGGTGRLV